MQTIGEIKFHYNESLRSCFPCTFDGRSNWFDWQRKNRT